MSFKFEYDANTNDDMIFYFQGIIDSSAELPDLSQYQDPVIYIDLGDVKLINSGGIRSWLLWIEKYEYKKFSFYRIPVFFSNQLQFVDGLIPDRSNIGSFLVPYFCPKCDKDYDLLFYKNQEFTNTGEVIRGVKALCPDCQVTMEPSVFADNIFRALKLTPPQL